MPLLPTSRASFKGAYTIEKLFAALAALLQARKILVGGFDPAKTAIVAGQPYTLTSAPQAAELFGFGSQLHRMAIYHFLATGGSIPTVAFPLAAAGGGVAATKTVTFATDVTSSGTYVFRCGSYLTDDVIIITAAEDATPTEVAALLVAAVGEKPNLPFTAAAALGVVTLTAKTADATSEDLLVTVNQKTDEAEEAPEGMTVVIADGTTGAGKSDLSDFWDYLLTDSTPWFTGTIIPYDDTLELDGGADTVGIPSQQTGLYDGLDYRPTNIFTCGTDPGEAALTAAVALGDGRKNDAGNVRFEAPDYPELGYEIAAYVSGVIDLNSMIRSSSAYTRLALSALYGPLDPANDWTTKAPSGQKAYNNRDLAVRSGITPIIYLDGLAKPGDVTGFWRPDDNTDLPFGKVVNRWKAWNYQNITNVYLNGDDLADRPIVNSVAAVRQSEVAIDTDTVAAGLAQLAGIAENFGWIYDAEFTIKNTVVEESSVNPDRFDITTPIILSGNNRISLAEIQVDRNLQAVTLNLVA